MDRRDFEVGTVVRVLMSRNDGSIYWGPYEYGDVGMVTDVWKNYTGVTTDVAVTFASGAKDRFLTNVLEIVE